MDTVIFRALEARDYPDYKRLINEAWNTEVHIKKNAVLEAALDAYMRLGLLGATYAQVAEKDGRVLGIIAAGVNGQPALSNFRQTVGHLAALARTALCLPFCSSDDRRSLLAYMGEFTLHKKLLHGKKHRYDCAIVFFVMAQRSRGLGIGKALLARVFAYFRQCGARRACLFTDTWCNYGFYDSQGFTCAASRDIPGEDGSAFRHKIFLYEKAV